VNTRKPRECEWFGLFLLILWNSNAPCHVPGSFRKAAVMCEPCSGGFRVFYNVFDVLVCVCSAVYCRERVHRWIVGWFRWWVACVFAVGDVAPLTHPRFCDQLAGKLVEHPLDTVKVRLQAQQHGLKTVSVGFAQNSETLMFVCIRCAARRPRELDV
jgi:hypothetical protein